MQSYTVCFFIRSLCSLHPFVFRENNGTWNISHFSLVRWLAMSSSVSPYWLFGFLFVRKSFLCANTPVALSAAQCVHVYGSVFFFQIRLRLWPRNSSIYTIDFYHILIWAKKSLRLKPKLLFSVYWRNLDTRGYHKPQQPQASAALYNAQVRTAKTANKKRAFEFSVLLFRHCVLAYSLGPDCGQRKWKSMHYYVARHSEFVLRGIRYSLSVCCCRVAWCWTFPNLIEVIFSFFSLLRRFHIECEHREDWHCMWIEPSSRTVFGLTRCRHLSPKMTSPSRNTQYGYNGV